MFIQGISEGQSLSSFIETVPEQIYVMLRMFCVNVVQMFPHSILIDITRIENEQQTLITPIG
jgi:hypothetical protein